MINIQELITKIENADEVLVNINSNSFTLLANFGNEVSVDVGLDADKRNTFEIISSNGCAFDCYVEELESGSFEDDNYIFEHNGNTVYIGIIAPTTIS